MSEHDACTIPDDLDNAIDLDLEDAQTVRALAAGGKHATWADAWAQALAEELGSRVVFLKGWRDSGKGNWQHGLPRAMVLHHTAGAATSSTDPRNKGNQRGANNGVIRYVFNHPEYDVACSHICLDRDGTAYVTCGQWTYHAGMGSFPGSHTWDQLAIPDDRANEYTLGVEIVSKGLVDDLTEAQWKTLAGIMRANARACRWKGDATILRRPQHRDWAGNRKVDLRASNDKVTRKITQYI